MTVLLLTIIYLSFISLGLPDALLGAAWPSIYPEMGVSFSSAGIISTIIALGTIFSSLNSERLIYKLGVGKLTLLSVLTTAIALFGFSISDSFIKLCFFAIPYGLGAGSVDAALNNYVAINFKSRHMNWLHSMWGVGATIGPYIMGYTLINFNSWNLGYRYISILQFILTLILFISLPLWSKKEDKDKNKENIKKINLEKEDNKEKRELLGIKKAIKIPGVLLLMVCFFGYCAIEQTTGLWLASYLNLAKGIDSEKAAGFTSLFFMGVMIGRFLSGFVSDKLGNKKMIKSGLSVLSIGVIFLILSKIEILTIIGFLVIGLGCAPIYPSIIDYIPDLFGKEKSQAIIGIQMASAYLGTLIIPPLFGILADLFTISIFPYFILLITVIIYLMFNKIFDINTYFD